MKRLSSLRPHLHRRPSLDAPLAAAIHAMRSDLFKAMSEIHEVEQFHTGRERSTLPRTLQHLNALLDDLDWRRRLAQGAIAAQPARCDVSPVLASLAVDVEARHPESVVVVRCASDLPHAWIDPLRLRDVLGLVAEYAVQRAQSYVPTLELCATAHARSILITTHAGLCLRPVEQATLFAPLEFMPRSVLRDGPGLYVARTLARRIGGELGLQQRANGDCVLVLAMPRFIPKEARCTTC